MDSQHPQGDRAIAKRIPPSQRPERQLDDQARAIARMIEDDKAKKLDEKDAASPSGGRTFPSASGAPPKKFLQAKGTAPAISTKRPKAPGA